MVRALLFLLLCAASDGARAQILLNEVLYDPPGSDGGHEFVELYCGGPDSLSLDGLRLVFVNGADPDKPKTLWSAPAGIRIAPGSFFVLAESELPQRDVELTLGLQNGPDALWLLHNDTPIDRLAWGEMDGLGEGAPAPDVSSSSLGRVPDGADTDDNARDWRELERPSPGSANARAQYLQLLEMRGEPDWRSSAGSVELELLLTAVGHASSQGARLQWWSDSSLLYSEDLLLARDDSLELRLSIQLEEGRHRILAESSTQEGNSVLELGYQVGLAALRLNELMVRPLPDEPEWIELYYSGAGSDTLRGWSLCDASRAWRSLPPLHFSPGGFALLCSDPDAMRRVHGLPQSLPVFEPEGGWPTLNNSEASGSEFADEVLLRDDELVIVDQVRYREQDLPEPGRSLERARPLAGRARDWFAAPGPPTPGAENLNSAYAPPESGLLVRPEPFTPDGDGVDDLLHIQLRSSPCDGRIVAEIRDLAGERVAELGVETADAELQHWIWDGRDLADRPVPMGAYVVVVTAGGTRVPTRSWRALVALGRKP